MWSISQPKKGPLHCSCHLFAKGEALERIFLELLLAAHSRPQPKPTLKNHFKEWIELFLSASISHDPGLPQGSAVVESDMVNLGQWTAQQSPETNIITWLVIRRWCKVSQEAAITISEENEVLVGTAEVCASARQRPSEQRTAVGIPQGSDQARHRELPWKDARRESCG